MPRTPHFLTLSQAAKATGKSKSVISKALKTGVISYAEKDDSGYRIDPAELFRVFPANDLGENENGGEERSRTPERTDKSPVENGENGGEISVLRAENHLLHERLKDKDERIAELKSERDQWKNEKEHWYQAAQRLLLTYQPVKPDEAPDSAAAKQDKGAGEGRHWRHVGIVAALFALFLLASGVLNYFQGDIRAYLNRQIGKAAAEPQSELRFTLPAPWENS